MMDANQAAQIHSDTDIAKEEILFETFNQAIRNKAQGRIKELHATLEWIEDRGGLRTIMELGFRVWQDEDNSKHDIFVIRWAHEVKATIQ